VGFFESLMMRLVFSQNMPMLDKAFTYSQLRV
jgi:hypothetical protein